MDDPNGESIGSVSVPDGENGPIWKTVRGSVDVLGTHALYLVLSSEDEDSTLSVVGFYLSDQVEYRRLIVLYAVLESFSV